MIQSPVQRAGPVRSIRRITNVEALGGGRQINPSVECGEPPPTNSDSNRLKTMRFLCVEKTGKGKNASRETGLLHAASGARSPLGLSWVPRRLRVVAAAVGSERARGTVRIAASLPNELRSAAGWHAGCGRWEGAGRDVPVLRYRARAGVVRGKES